MYIWISVYIFGYLFGTSFYPSIVCDACGKLIKIKLEVKHGQLLNSKCIGGNSKAAQRILNQYEPKSLKSMQ